MQRTIAWPLLVYVVMITSCCVCQSLETETRRLAMPSAVAAILDSRDPSATHLKHIQEVTKNSVLFDEAMLECWGLKQPPAGSPR